MPSLMETPRLLSLLRQSTDDKRKMSSGVFRMFKLLPMLTSGCKMVALLGSSNKGLLGKNPAAVCTVTLFGNRKGRVTLAIQEDPKGFPTFLIELPMLTSALHKEMASGLVKIALESETRTPRKKLMEEYVWAVFCNGRKSGYSIRRKQTSEDENYVMQLLRGVSMGAGVLPCPSSSSGKEVLTDGELTYMRAPFERVVGSKDSEALYMTNPDGTGGPELSIFLVRFK